MGCCHAAPSIPAPQQSFFLVGPVVGSVDGCSARILVETAEQAELNVSVLEAVESNTKGPFGFKRSFIKVVEGTVPTVLVIKDLKPGYAYQVVITGRSISKAHDPGRDLAASTMATFSTIKAEGSGRKQNLRLGFVSCNNFMWADRSKLWSRVLYEINHNGGLDYLIHMGDQVYADGELYKVEKGLHKDEQEAKYIMETSAWFQGRAHLSRAGQHPADWEPYRPQVLELFRATYRKTWGLPEVAAVLASVPNMMVLDDHELRDDFGDRPEDTVRDSMEFFLGTCGLQVYHEYQTQLHRDVRPADVLNEKVYSSHVIGGKVGIFLMDIRVERSVRRVARGVCQGDDWTGQGFLGPEQHQDLMAALDGKFKDVSQLFIVSPTPMVLMSDHLTMFLSKTLDDLLGTWTATPFIKERDALLDRFVDWAEKDQTRSVTLMAGDLHIGGHSSVTLTRGSSGGQDDDDDEGKRYTVHQLTASAIACNFYEEQEVKQLVGSAAMIVDADLTSAGAKNHIKFRHDKYEYVNNVGIVDIRLSDSSLYRCRPTVKASLLLGNANRTSRNYDLTMTTEESGGRCTVM